MVPLFAALDHDGILVLRLHGAAEILGPVAGVPIVGAAAADAEVVCARAQATDPILTQIVGLDRCGVAELAATVFGQELHLRPRDREPVFILQLSGDGCRGHEADHGLLPFPGLHIRSVNVAGAGHMHGEWRFYAEVPRRVRPDNLSGGRIDGNVRSGERRPGHAIDHRALHRLAGQRSAAQKDKK